jgi:hypothetical protein
MVSDKREPPGVPGEFTQEDQALLIQLPAQAARLSLKSNAPPTLATKPNPRTNPERQLQRSISGILI